MEKQEAVVQLNELVKNAENALKEAEAFADKYGLGFHFCPEYGMGGTYFGIGSENWNSSNDDQIEQYGQWVSSSANC